MKDILKNVKKSKAFWVCLVISIILILGGAIVPPPFVIDNSIFIAVGELFAFATLSTVISAIDKGMDAKITHNNTTVEINNEKDSDNTDDSSLS